MKQTTRGNIAL